MVHGPYSDFRLMAANRFVSDRLRREAVWDNHAYQRILERKEQESAALRGALQASEEKSAEVATQSWERFDLLIQERAKNARLIPWATIGKVAVITVGVGATVAAVLAARGAVGP
jgi:hypothetical protein